MAFAVFGMVKQIVEDVLCCIVRIVRDINWVFEGALGILWLNGCSTCVSLWAQEKDVEC